MFGEVLMREKYYEFTSFILMGIFLVILGVLLFLGKNNTYQYFVDIFVLVLWISSFRELVKFFFRKLSRREENKTFLSCVFHLFICVFFTLIPDFLLGIVPILFSIYFILIGITQFVMCFLEIKDEQFIHFRYIVIGSFCLIMAFPLLISPVDSLNRFLSYFSLYIVLLGLSMVWDAIFRLVSDHTKNKLKRKIRITLPKIVEAIIPYSIMSEINRNLALDKKQVYSFDKEYTDVDMHILIHTSNRGFNRMGHIDLCFDGTVFSFGNYDEGSRIFNDTFGSGVLFMTNRKEDYINFCIDHSKKTVFDFGIVLNDKQKLAIRRRIDEIMIHSTSWNHKEDKKYNYGNSYAAMLYKKTRARFYKFTKGRYCTYFVLGTNCCFLVDDIVGKCGMDIVSINGIITPGTYYDYLNRELRVKKSNVVSKDIYNKYHRAKEIKK